MTMCFFLEWSRTDIINFWIAFGTVATALLTLGLLLVASKGFKKLLSQEASKDQLKIVGQLISDLVYAGLKIESKNITNSTIPFNAVWNIFSFASLPLVEHRENFEVLLTVKIYDTELQNAFQHLGNPLLPPKIASSLMTLMNIAPYAPLDEYQDKKAQYILGPDVAEIQGIISISKFKVNGGINGWLQATKNIQKSIIKWYDEKGIKEINHFALRSNKGIK
jgi:hypothetical protein